MNDLASLIRPNLVLIKPELTTSTAVIEALGALLIENGYGKITLVKAALEREGTYPTGLLLDSDGVNAAIPHADREHVISAAAAVAVLGDAVLFHQMDEPETEIPVRLVFLLALPDADSQLHTLRTLGKTLQDSSLIAELLSSTTPESLVASLAGGGTPT